MNTIDIEALKAEVNEFKNTRFIPDFPKPKDYQNLISAAEKILEKYKSLDGEVCETCEACTILASLCTTTGFKLLMDDEFFDEGAEFYHKALELCPNSYDVHWGYYTSLEEIVEDEDYATPELIEDAIKCLTFCIDYCTTPELKEEKRVHFRYFELARVYLAANEIEKAIECAKKSLEINDSDSVREFVEKCEGMLG